MTESTTPEKTPEQLNAEAEAKAKAEAKQKEKEAKKAEADKARADKKAKREAEKAAVIAKREAEKQAKAEKKAAAEKAKEDAKQPESNGVRRPKPETICGKIWSKADELSQASGSPATIGDLMKAMAGTADATVRTQYARWRKYYGVTGRAEAPAAPASTPAAT